MTHFTESTIEETALEWLKDKGYTIVFGGDIASSKTLASPRNGMSQLKLMRDEVRAKEVEKEL
jgi:hypothetical protein